MELNNELSKILKDAEDKALKSGSNKKHAGRLSNDNTVIFIDVPDNHAPALIYSLAEYFNKQHKTFGEFSRFCTERECSGNKKKGHTLARNIITTIRRGRGMQIRTLEIVCDFLQCEVVLESNKRASDGN
jgi:DNA-binding Xre family transcriptional regulator